LQCGPLLKKEIKSIDKGNDVEPVQRGISVPVIKNTKKPKIK
jgi:hypothetical protein